MSYGVSRQQELKAKRDALSPSIPENNRTKGSCINKKLQRIAKGPLFDEGIGRAPILNIESFTDGTKPRKGDQADVDSITYVLKNIYFADEDTKWCKNKSDPF